MTEFLKIIYKLGGYNPKIIKAGHLGSRYLLPGLSLLIIFVTSSYGGWHLADTITSGWYRYLFTIGFISLILLVDYLLLQGEKSRWSFATRVLLSFSLGSIITILSILQIFENDITANNIVNINNETNNETKQRTDEIKYWKSLINDSIPKYDNLSTKAHKGDYVTDDGKKIPACGIKELDQSYCRTFARKRDNFQNIYDENRDKIVNEESYIKGKEKEVKERNPNAIIGQIENLWELIEKNKLIMGVWVCLIFIALMALDLTPIMIKFSTKDKLDADYEAKKTELQTEKDVNGNVLWYNAAKEKYFLKSKKQKTKIDLEAIRQKNEFELAKFNEESLKEMNSLYALEKYDELLAYFKDKKVPEHAIKKIFDLLHGMKSETENGE